MRLERLAVVLLSVALTSPLPFDGVSATTNNCPATCGGMEIPYPFGIGHGCAMPGGFEISCNDTGNGTYKPFLSNVEVLNISLPQGQARLLNRISSYCYNNTSRRMNPSYWHLNMTNTPYRFSNTENKFTVLGCRTLACIGDENFVGYTSGCVAICRDEAGLTDGPCSGVGCCQTAIPKGLEYYQVVFDESFNTTSIYTNSCSYAVLMEASNFEFRASYANTSAFHDANGGLVPIVVDWAIGNKTCEEARKKPGYACISSSSECFNSAHGSGYICNCSNGFQGNPYISNGCRDIDECADVTKYPCSVDGTCHNTLGGFKCLCPPNTRGNAYYGTCDKELMLSRGARVAIGICTCIFGTLIILFVIQLINHKKSVKIQAMRRKRDEYFQQHGGQLLSDMTKMERNLAFTLYHREDIEAATNGFDKNEIIGEGGQGTVYKGILDNTILAIKRCKGVDEDRRMEFGKELLILCRVNHPNIVKLLGCCLQFEVPILVYEYVPNKTLYDLIHGEIRRHCITLATRLRIAADSAEALAYLHLLRHPILHGDVKSANILLGDNFEVKVSDFGSSMIAPMDDEAQVVKGTLGYLDPEYLQSYQLTAKSDVYSFSVIILELLTGKTPRSKEKKSLVSVFQEAMRKGRVDELLDTEIVYEDDIEVIHQVTKLASRCLVMPGENRPTMRQVALELKQLAGLVQPHPQAIDGLNPNELGSSNIKKSILYTTESAIYYSLEKKATLST